MSKIEAVDSLLPGFQQFLSDLSKIKGNLTSSLVGKVDEYQQGLNDYIEQHSTAPSAPLPPVPIASKSDIDIERERNASWQLQQRQSQLISPQVDYQNFQQNGGPIAPDPLDLYEDPVSSMPPEVPSLDKIPRRVVDVNEDFYEEPDSDSARGSMPPGSDEGSGNQFVFGGIPEEYDSDASTDYEDIEDDLEENVKNRNSSAEPTKKVKVDKLQQFLDEHSLDEEYDLIDKLHYYNNVIGTLKGNLSIGKWEKRYCIAQDGQIFLYKNPKDKKNKAQRLPLMGYDVYMVGTQSGKEYVFRIYHSSMKHPLLLAADAKVVTDKWVAVLKRYATIDHTITPVSGYQQEPADDKGLTKKAIKHTEHKDKKKSKEKDGTQQLTVDSSDNLSGYINIYGAKYGEPKVRRKWITIEDEVFSAYIAREDHKMFTFSLHGIQIENADKKEAKMKGAFKLIQEGEVLIYLEALNKVDAGHLLKKLVEISLPRKHETEHKISPEAREISHTETDKTAGSVVAKLMAAFENPAEDQTDGNEKRRSAASIPSPKILIEETYDDIESVAPSPPEQSYQNVTVLQAPQDSASRRRSLADMIFHKKSNSVEEQPLYDDACSDVTPAPDEIYDDVIGIEPSQEKQSTPIKGMIFNFKNNKKEKDNQPSTPPVPESSQVGEKKETEKERKAREKKEKKEKEDREKKERKEKKEKEKKEKRDEEKRKKKEREDSLAKEQEEKASLAPAAPPPAVPSPAPSPKVQKKEAAKVEEVKKEVPKKEEEKQQPNKAITRQLSTVAKFKDSGMGHLILKDKLMQDRKELEEQKKLASQKKGEIRLKMQQATDPNEKAKYKQEFDTAQKEWSEVNKKLVDISVQIEGATAPVKKDENANAKAATLPRSPVRAGSPERGALRKGNVSDMMKKFQQN